MTDTVTEPFDVLGAGAGGPLPPFGPWSIGSGYIQYGGGVVVGPGVNMGPGIITTAGLYIGGTQFDNTTVVMKAGGTMTGPLVLSGLPTSASQAATKQYVDNQVASAGQGEFLPLTGGTLTGLLTLSADPAAPLGSATKNYVDTRTPITVDAPANGEYFTRYNNTWQILPAGLQTPDAPTDGNTYARMNAVWTNVYDGNVGTNAIKILRSSVAGSRPTGRAFGEPYVNFADNQFGVVNSAGATVDLIGAPIFSPLASYAAGVTVNSGGRLYVSLVAVAPGTWNPAQWSIVPSASTLAATYVPFTGGTLTGPLTLAADPTAALGAATKQYVDNAPKGSAPQHGYFQITASTQCGFYPYKGGNIRISGIDRNIPPGGLFINTTNQVVEGNPGQNLAANATYYVYAYWTGSAVALNCSQTAFTTDGTAGNVGVAIKGNDASQSLVGMVRLTGSGTIQDSSNYRGVASWFNRRWKTSSVGLGNNSSNSTNLINIGGAVQIVCWADDEVQVWLNGQLGISNNSGNTFGQVTIGMDGSTGFDSATNFTFSTSAAAMAVVGSGGVGSNGIHYWYAFIMTSNASYTVSLNNAYLLARFRG